MLRSSLLDHLCHIILACHFILLLTTGLVTKLSDCYNTIVCMKTLQDSLNLYLSRMYTSLVPRPVC